MHLYFENICTAPSSWLDGLFKINVRYDVQFKLQCFVIANVVCIDQSRSLCSKIRTSRPHPEKREARSSDDSLSACENNQRPRFASFVCFHLFYSFAISNIMSTCNASSIDFQFLAFSHLSLPVGGRFEGFPLDSQLTFKPLVDEYYTYLNSNNVKDDISFKKFSHLVDTIAAFPWIGGTASRTNSLRLMQIKDEFFEVSMAALSRLGGFIIHPDNNAWLVIVYTLREMIMIPKDEFKTLFKMVPLVDGHDYAPIPGWAQVPSDTKFAKVVFNDINEATRTIKGKGLIDLDSPSISCIYWHPLMLKVGTSIHHLPNVYMKQV
jgi:hypothetical protein